MRKYLFGSSIIIGLFILIIFFLWKESLSLNSPINAEKFAAFGTMVGSLLTALTVYFLYKQINEQINDRKANNLPDLYPSQLNLETHDTTIEYADGTYGVHPKFFRTSNPDSKKKQSSPRAFCIIHNIGLAAAKEISIEWKYSLEEVKKYTKQVYDLNGYDSESDNQTYDFLAANNSMEIEVSENYLRCCGIQLNKFEDIENGPPYNSKPALNLVVKYLDIYNNEYKKHFNVNFFCIHSYVYITFRQQNLQNK